MSSRALGLGIMLGDSLTQAVKGFVDLRDGSALYTSYRLYYAIRIFTIRDAVRHETSKGCWRCKEGRDEV